MNIFLKKFKMSQDFLASKLKISQPFFSRCLSGKASLSEEKLLEMYKILSEKSPTLSLMEVEEAFSDNKKFFLRTSKKVIKANEKILDLWKKSSIYKELLPSEDGTFSLRELVEIFSSSFPVEATGWGARTKILNQENLCAILYSLFTWAGEGEILLVLQPSCIKIKNLTLEKSCMSEEISSLFLYIAFGVCVRKVDDKEICVYFKNQEGE